MVRRLVLWPLGLVAMVIAALGMGAVPLPASYLAQSETSAPVVYRIHVLSNGFHAAIALPADARLPGQGDSVGPSVMEALALDPGNHPVDPAAVRYWLIGWGSETAYTSLRAVRDLTVGIAAQALTFDESVMHVQPLGALQAGSPGLYSLDVSAAQLAALVASIAPSFASTEPIADVTQGFGDRFFPGQGRFSPLVTCNTWVGRRLRDAGIGVGLWTPTAQTLEFSLRRVSVDQAR